MLFNSFQYFLIFLPASVALYYLTLYFLGQLPSKIILIAASLFFYGFWDYTYLPLLIASIIVNYAIGFILLKNQTKSSNSILYFIFGMMFNLCLLGYFKYTAFILENINILANSNIKIPEITLPLAISFFTFQQIIFLVDPYKGVTEERNFINYSLFVSFLNTTKSLRRAASNEFIHGPIDWGHLSKTGNEVLSTGIAEVFLKPDGGARTDNCVY